MLLLVVFEMGSHARHGRVVSRVRAIACATVPLDTPTGDATKGGIMRSLDRRKLLSYPKARLAAGLRMSWAPRAGFEPASLRWTGGCSTT